MSNAARRIKPETTELFRAIGKGWSGREVCFGPYGRKGDAKRAVTDQFSGNGRVQVAEVEWKDVPADE